MSLATYCAPELVRFKDNNSSMWPPDHLGFSLILAKYLLLPLLLIYSQGAFLYEIHHLYVCCLIPI